MNPLLQRYPLNAQKRTIIRTLVQVGRNSGMSDGSIRALYRRKCIEHGVTGDALSAAMLHLEFQLKLA